MSETECEHPRESLEKVGPRYRCVACRKILRPREAGMNPRALNLDPGLRGVNPRAAGRNTRATGRNPRALKAAYYRISRESTVLRDGGYRLEFVPWKMAGGAVIRRKGRWELRVYPVDGGGVEAALVDPDGNVRTYT
jgi:hypothetical protein